MNKIDILLKQIFEKVNTNVIIQVQSYGRVFIYDQKGKIVDIEDAICIFPNGKSVEEKIIAGLERFEQKRH